MRLMRFGPAIAPGARAAAALAGGLALSLAALGVLAGPGEATFPGRNGKIAFGAYRHAFQRIFVMNADGSHRRRISRGDRDGADPSFSPSGGRIAFGSFRKERIFLMRADGTHRRRLSHFISFRPAFAPSGKDVAFYGGPGHKVDIYVVRTDGTHLRRITHNPGLDEDPAYAPDGKRIAFDSLRGDALNFGVYVMRSDGSRQRKLDGHAFDPSFSPSGRRILYSSFNANHRDQIYSIRLNGGHRRTITHNHSRHFEYGSPVFSPNGKRIVFDAGIVKRNGEIGRIYVMRRDGTHERRLLNTGLSYGPDWGRATG